MEGTQEDPGSDTGLSSACSADEDQVGAGGDKLKLSKLADLMTIDAWLMVPRESLQAPDLRDLRALDTTFGGTLPAVFMFCA